MSGYCTPGSNVLEETPGDSLFLSGLLMKIGVHSEEETTIAQWETGMPGYRGRAASKDQSGQHERCLRRQPLGKWFRTPARHVGAIYHARLSTVALSRTTSKTHLVHVPPPCRAENADYPLTQVPVPLPRAHALLQPSSRPHLHRVRPVNRSGGQRPPRRVLVQLFLS